jgi:ubiquinone/menaquinone biosynthesis C-methylase UbiE
MQIEKDRFFSLAETFDNVAQIVVPAYDFLQDEALRFLDYSKDHGLKIVDLGGGSGIMLEKILKKYPNSECFWVDYSDDFRRVAQKRLLRFADRVHYLECDILSDWDKQIGCKPDLIISMSTIHHLEDGDKKSLYSKCYHSLRESGWFVNIDEMRTLSTVAYKNSLLQKERYALKAGDSLSEDRKPYYSDYLRHLKHWRERNIVNFDLPKQKGDDIHASFCDQVEWLTEIGYKNSDVIIKYHLMSIIVGQK